MTKYVMCAIVLLFVVNVLSASASNQVTNYNATPLVPGLKSKGTAYLWSLGATVVPLVIVSGGNIDTDIYTSLPIAVIIGPSAGHCYAGNWGQGLWGAGIRLGVAAAGLGAAYALSESHSTISSGQAVVFTIAGSIILGSMIYDYVTISRSVDEYNAAVLKGSSMQIMPHIDFKNHQYGISMKYFF